MVSPALEQSVTERAGRIKLVKVDIDRAPPSRGASRSARCRVREPQLRRILVRWLSSWAHGWWAEGSS
ncbi:hypothetical protein [Pseudonocardia aurantiaca]|uniref:Uncharacterized protein n=1 Tax=Pseudonocardia aurantiaca TaxID=75290 RepID=A0ABW4FXC3_9PSEU